ncbi:hypothetical protein Pla123a_16410 [Posidoniimonas polymericola]|uniref:Uncharacterized protein n=1 Tax=Posidoniimonas polymericola TaxID=2528002 RepID=A0A5C5YSC3_9BACT|nr:hypothetical protein [Posidoniimonas polymericola]TWT77845.1 hypothetical protein Pla123a_16410 [Posidoniimonas polymericola]
MPVPSVSGLPLSFPSSVAVGPPQPAPRAPAHARQGSVWQRWASLRSDILRHIHACDQSGKALTIDQLAADLDEALGLVERRTQELQSLRLIRCHEDRRIELEPGSQLKCG